MITRFDDGGGGGNRLDRRQFLAGAGGVLAALAGCTESDDGGDGAEPSPNGGQGTTTTGTSTTKGTTTGRGTSANETTGDEENLDLREANVVQVTFDRQDGTIQFAVTLYHDDDGEAKYANWWQVETLDGHRLGRRKLLHAHSTAPFTRSETVDVPDGTDCVVVRGHDQIHDYGGQAALVNVESGETSLIRQGADRRSFDAAECP